MDVKDVLLHGRRQRIVQGSDHRLPIGRTSVCAELCVEQSFRLRHGEGDLQDIAGGGERFHGSNIGRDPVRDSRHRGGRRFNVLGDLG